MNRYVNPFFATAMVWLATCALCPAQMLREKPVPAQGIGVDQKLGQSVALDAKFYDDANNFVSLGDYFDGKRPVILSFNYSDCPQLCITQFNNLVVALLDLDLVPGQDFQIVSISLDWRERPGKAQETKTKYVANYGKPKTANGWHFLTGNEAAIHKAADACGIRYKYVVESDTFSHPAAFIFCSPQGEIIRYLDGLDRDLNGKIRPALIEASEGRMGTVIEQAMYFSSCFVYDPVSGKYTFVARRIMMYGAGATVVCLLVGLLPYWIRRRKKEAPSKDEAGFQSNTAGGMPTTREALS
jgi:protein SCO1/2